MESAIILTAVFFAVTIPLALCTRIATAYRDGTKQGNREDELIAEIERLNEALLDVSVKLQAKDKLVKAYRKLVLPKD